jgi:OOP family OmpA-OmpF porin
MKKLLLSTVLAMIGLVSPASAGDFFLGVSVGQGTLETIEGGSRIDIDDTAYKLFVGYEFFKFFGLEGAWTDLGEFDETVDGVAINAEADYFSLMAVGNLPISPRLDLWAKFGVADWETDFSIDDVPGENSGTDTGWGIGATFRFTRRIALRGEWERFDFEETEDVSFGSLGLQFNF